MNNKWTLRMTAAILAALLAGPVQVNVAGAVPALPASFFGAVTNPFNSAPVPAGLTVAAIVNGAVVGQALTFSSGGLTVYRLDVNGDDPDTPQKEGGVEGEAVGLLLESRISQTGVWRGGTSTRLDLTWTPPASRPPVTSIIAPPPEPPAPLPATGVLVAPPPAEAPSAVQINIIGTAASLSRDASGRMLQEARIVVGTRGMAMTIQKGTLLSRGDGSPVTAISVQPVSANTPPLPPGRAVIGQVLNFLPAGLKLDPPARMTLDYSPLLLPPGIADLSAAYFSGTGWTPVKTVADKLASTVTFEVDRSGMFALLAGTVTPQSPPPAHSAAHPAPAASPPPAAAPAIPSLPPVAPVQEASPPRSDSPQRGPAAESPQRIAAPPPADPPASEAPAPREEVQGVAAPAAAATEPPSGPPAANWPLMGIIAALIALGGAFVVWRTWFYSGVARD